MSFMRPTGRPGLWDDTGDRWPAQITQLDQPAGSAFMDQTTKAKDR